MDSRIHPDAKVTRLEAATLTVNHLLNNSTTHESPFSAIAELVDNAYDAKAENLYIDVCGEHPNERLEVRDDGHGMTREEALSIIKFGFSEKDGCAIGRYGNGLKSGGFHLGRDLLLLTKKDGIQTAVFISHTFLESQNCRDTVYVPCPSMYENGQAYCLRQEEEDRFDDEIEFINQYQRYNGGELHELFEKIPGDHGTLIIISKLQRTPIGELMINIKEDGSDIKIDAEDLPNHKCSLRAYLQILYLHPKMAIHLRRSLVYPRKVLSGWMARCYTDTSASLFNEGRNDMIKKYKEEKFQLEQRKRDLITDNAQTNMEGLHHVERMKAKNRFQRSLAEVTEELALRDRWIAQAEKNSKESTFRSYLGINVKNRNEHGIHFYINNRLIIWGHKSPFFKKKETNEIGISMCNELDFDTFRPTHNKQGFSSAKDFNSLVKKGDAYLQLYHEWAEKLWIPPHLNKRWMFNATESDNVWQTMWEKFGYFSLRRAPNFNEQQRLAIDNECGIWRLCLSCRKWKRLKSMEEFVGPSNKEMFECRSVSNQNCYNYRDIVSDGADAMLLPEKAKLAAAIASKARRPLKLAPPSSSFSRPSPSFAIPSSSSMAPPKSAAFTAPYSFSLSPSSSSSLDSSAGRKIAPSKSVNRTVLASKPSIIPSEKQIKEEDEAYDFRPPSTISDYSSVISESDKSVKVIDSTDDDLPPVRVQRVHATKPTEKISRRRIHESEDDDDDDEDWAPKKPKQSTSEIELVRQRSSSSAKPKAGPSKPTVSLPKPKTPLEKLEHDLAMLLDHLAKSQTHKLKIPTKGSVAEKLSAIANVQIPKLKRM